MSKNAVSSIAGGGEPPYDVEMDRRLTVLETRFDTILPTLATKSDLADLRQEMRVGFEIQRGEFRAENENLRGEFRAENEKLRGEFRAENEKLRGEVRSENEKLRTELHRSNLANMRWFMASVVSLFICAITVNVTMFNALKKDLLDHQHVAAGPAAFKPPSPAPAVPSPPPG